MRITLFLLLILAVGQLMATPPVIGITTFNNNFSMQTPLLGSTPSPGTVTNVGNTGETGGILASGWDFTVTVPGSNVSMSAAGAGANPGGTSDFCIRMNSLTAGVSVQTIAAKSNDGSTFGLQSVYLKLNISANAPANMILTGYHNGVAVPGATLTINSIPTATWTQFNVSAMTAFFNIDEFRFTQASGSTAIMSNEAVDQITTAAPINLPLTLLNFSAQPDQNKVHLQWATAQEENTASFEVQRSNTDANFATIGQVAAAGNSTQTISYDYTDLPPAGSDYFYRLRMTDRDGKFTYSSTVKINLSSPGAALSAWPNPFRSQLTLSLQAAAPDKAKLIISDMGGKIVSSQTLTLQPGTNSFTLPSVERLGKGVYILQITTLHQQQQLQVVKLE